MEDPDFEYSLEVTCCNCNAKMDMRTSLNSKIPDPHKILHSSKRCTECGELATVGMVSGNSRPLTHHDAESGTHALLMKFVPVKLNFGAGWRAVSTFGTRFEKIDLSDDYFSEYCEKGETSVTISNTSSEFAADVGGWEKDEGERFYCVHCKNFRKGFATKGKLHTHIKREHGVMYKLPCWSGCGNFFVERNMLEDHLQACRQ